MCASRYQVLPTPPLLRYQNVSVEWSAPCEVTYSGTSKQRPHQGTSLLAFVERLWSLFLCKPVNFGHTLYLYIDIEI